MLSLRACVPPNNPQARAAATVPNFLQFTSALFLLPAALCVVKGRLVGVAVYSANAVCSVYVHRPDRSEVDNEADVADKVCVAAWVIYNAAVWYKSSREIAPVVCAVIVLITKVATRYLEYRSLRRYAVHCCMHMFGVVGSLLLFV